MRYNSEPPSERALASPFYRLFRALFTRHRSADLVRRYYAALQAEDYSDALECLGSTMQTPQERPVTEEWLRETEGPAAAGGRITGHAIVNFNIHYGWRLLRIPGIASFTVKVTRGERSYFVYPRVREEGGQWTIAAFDPGQLILPD